MKSIICENTVIHKEKVENVCKQMLTDEKIFDLAEFFKVFGDTTRMKIICALLKEELCVCDLACIISSTSSAVSHQLRILKQAKLVKYKKVGKVIYYSLTDHHISEIFAKGCEHLDEI